MAVPVPPDSVLALGDSISVATWGGPVTRETDFPEPSYSEQIHSLHPLFRPTVFNAAVGGTTSADGLALMPNMLLWNPGPKICVIAFGTNDGPAGITPSVYQANMEAMIALVKSAGKTPVIPSIPFASAEPWHSAIPALNAIVTGVLWGLAGVRQGPDLNAYFTAHPELLQSDGVHPTMAGYQNVILMWAQAMSWAYP